MFFPKSSSQQRETLSRSYHRTPILAHTHSTLLRFKVSKKDFGNMLQLKAAR